MNDLNHSRDILKNAGFSLLAEGKTIRIKAHGYSMYPTIKPGAVILIEPVKIKGLPKPGEIIAIKRNNGLVVHRLVRVEKKQGTNFFFTRGDSNAWPDNPVKADKIAGRITGMERDGKNQTEDLFKNTRPAYFMNRMRVIWILVMKKLKKI